MASRGLDPGKLLSHQAMLSDRTRLRAFAEALGHAVGPGALVADVGAGTLVLSALALEAGAAHVYAVEGDPDLAALARRIRTASGLKELITVVEADARTARLPVRVDTVVSEMFGNFGPEEEPFDVLRAFARTNLREGGAVVPRALRAYVAAVNLGGSGWGVWSEAFCGLDLSVVQRHAPTGVQLHVAPDPPLVLAGPALVHEDTLAAQRDPWTEPWHTLVVERAGTLHGILGYFEAELAPGVRLSNHPSYQGCNWALCLWPLRHTEVAPGDRVEVSFQRPARLRDILSWHLDTRLRPARGGP